MKKSIVILIAILLTTILAGCSEIDDSASSDSNTLADHLNETNAVIGAGDVYDTYILINNEPVEINLMRVYSNQGYQVDYPFEFFEYYTDSSANYLTDSGSDRFVWSADNQSEPRNYIEISRLSESVSEAAARLEQEFSSQYSSIGRASVEFNVSTAELICCTTPIDDSVPSDILIDCYIVHNNDGCRVITVHYSTSSADSIYPYMKALLDEIQLTLG